MTIYNSPGEVLSALKGEIISKSEALALIRSAIKAPDNFDIYSQLEILKSHPYFKHAFHNGELVGFYAQREVFEKVSWEDMNIRAKSYYELVHWLRAYLKIQETTSYPEKTILEKIIQFLKNEQLIQNTEKGYFLVVVSLSQIGESLKRFFKTELGTREPKNVITYEWARENLRYGEGKMYKPSVLKKGLSQKLLILPKAERT